MLYAASEFVERYPHEETFAEWVRFRTVGDMSCTGGVRSRAATIEEVVREIAATRDHRARRDARRRQGAPRPRWRTASGSGTSDGAPTSRSCSPARPPTSELLRLVTCGSVDDGKSTLIGRLLFDTKQVMSDQLEHVEETSERRGDGYVNLALLTDGLRAEREQGITIDVAYRSFVTPTRRFQLADAPGPRPVHAQHGHRRLDRRRRGRPARRAQGRDRADAAAHLHRLDARDPARRLRRQQDGPRRLRRGALPRDRARPAPSSRRASSSATRRRSRSRRCPATTSSTPPTRMPWWDGRHVPRAARDDRDRRRPRRRAPPLPRAVGDPADVGRAPRLPRLRGPGRGRRVARGRRGRRPAVGAPHDRRRGRDPGRAARRRRAGAVGGRPARGRRRRLPRRHALRPDRPARCGARRSRPTSAG